MAKGLSSMDIVNKRKIFLAFSGFFVGISVLAIFVFGLKEGIDFKGGTLWQFRFSEEYKISDLENIIRNEIGISDFVLTYDSSNKNFLLKTKEISEESHEDFFQKFRIVSPSFEELSFSSIGPSVGKELRRKSMIAIVLVLIGISFYIAFAFRKVYRPVSSWTYGLITLITLFHDVAVPAGLLAVLGHYLNVEVDGNFVVALLVVMGFSVHDTIVVFDRIRENLLLDKGKTDFGEVINKSVNQTLARSVNTSLTLILVLIALYLVGPQNLRYFVLTLLVGVSVGIYSSIFLASPLLLVWHNRRNERK